MSNYALNKVKLGESLPNKLLSRCDVADGTSGRVIPLYESAVAVNVFYSEVPKGSFMCSPEQALKIGASPRSYYVIPVLRLNTDARSKPIDNTFRLEYLRLGYTQYIELCQSMEETEGMSSLVITKQVKGDYSYIKPTVSTKILSKEIMDLVETFKTSLDEDQIFSFAVADMARPFEEYLRIINNGTTALPEAKKDKLSPVSKKAISEAEAAETDEFETTEEEWS